MNLLKHWQNSVHWGRTRRMCSLVRTLFYNLLRVHHRLMLEMKSESCQEVYPNGGWIDGYCLGLLQNLLPYEPV